LLEAGQRGGTGRAATLASRSLVIVEIGLACVLLVGAGLLIRSFGELLNVDLGFRPAHALAWRADSPRAFGSAAEGVRYYDQMVERIAAVPGVESAGLTDTLPLGRNRSWGVGAKGAQYRPGESPDAFPRIVDQHYLQTMGIPLRAGRYFDARDTADAEKVIVLNESLARRLWPDRDAIGQEVNLGGGSYWRVVGVVGDVRHSSLEERPEGEMYLNYHQSDDWFAIELVVRTSRSPKSIVPDVRAAMKAFDPALPNGEFTTLEQIVDHAVAPRRLIMNLLGAFSSLALLLASIGLYGVIAYSVGQRTQEIGVRLAIGAQRGDVLRLILGEGLKMAMIGVGLGLIAALLTTRLLQTMLFGVSATDPFTFGINVVILITVALGACLVPARRASKVDPMVALRYE
jgi:predicted permease